MDALSATIVSVFATLCIAQVASVWFLVRALREVVRTLREDRKLQVEEHKLSLDRLLAAANSEAYSIVQATEQARPPRDRRFSVKEL